MSRNLRLVIYGFIYLYLANNIAFASIVQHRANVASTKIEARIELRLKAGSSYLLTVENVLHQSDVNLYRGDSILTSSAMQLSTGLGASLFIDSTSNLDYFIQTDPYNDLVKNTNVKVNALLIPNNISILIREFQRTVSFDISADSVIERIDLLLKEIKSITSDVNIISAIEILSLSLLAENHGWQTVSKLFEKAAYLSSYNNKDDLGYLSDDSLFFLTHSILRSKDVRWRSKTLKTLSSQLKQFKEDPYKSLYKAEVDAHIFFFNILDILDKKNPTDSPEYRNNILKLEKLYTDETIPDYSVAKATVAALLGQGYAFNSDKLDLGIERLKQSISILESGKNYSSVATQYSNISNLYAQNGKYKENLWTLTKAIATSDDSYGHEHLGVFYSNLSQTYLDIGDYYLALTAAVQARSKFELANKHRSIASTDLKLARCHRYLGNLTKAKSHIDNAIKFYRSVEQKKGINRTVYEATLVEQLNIGLELWEKNGSDSKVENNIDVQLHITEGVSLGFYQENLELSKIIALAKYDYFHGLFEDSLDKLKLVKQLSIDNNKLLNAFSLFEFYELSIKANMALERYSSVRQEISLMFEFINRMRNEVDERFLGGAISAKARLAVTPYLEYLLNKEIISGSVEGLNEALTLIERVTYVNLKRSRSNASQLENTTKVFSELNDLLSKRQNAFLSKIDSSSDNKLLFGAYDVYLRLSVLRKDIVKHTNSEEIELDIEDLQNHIGKDAAVVFFSGVSNTYTIYFDEKKHWVAKTNTPASILKDKVFSYTKSLELRNRPYKQLSTELAANLNLGLLDIKEFNELFLLLDASLEQLPISSLKFGVEKFSLASLGVGVTRIFSLDNFFETNQSNPTPPENRLDFFVIADPIFDQLGDLPNSSKRNQEFTLRTWREGLNPLPATRLEANSISSIYSEKKVKVALGGEATTSSLLSNEAITAKVLHLATHGFYDPNSPFLVGLAVTKEKDGSHGFISLAQLQTVPIKSNLVVISGCDTVLGVSQAGEGLNGLSTGFIAQGAGAVVGTLWSVPDIPTSKFMKAFYESLLKNNGDTAKALRDAKLQFISSRRYSHPFYWASFSLASSNRSAQKEVF